MLKPSSLVVAAVLSAGLILGVSTASVYNYRHSESITQNISTIEETILNSTGLINYNGRELGSGVAYRKGGKLYVMSAAHVVDDKIPTIGQILGTEPPSDAPQTWGKGVASVVFFDSSTSERRVEAKGTIVAVDELVDYCIIEITDTDAKVLESLKQVVGVSLNYDIPDVGTKVYASGYPAGDEFTLTAGIISHKKRMLDSKQYIATDANITHGSSGGGLYLQKDASCVGIIVMGNMRNRQGYSVPMWVIKKSLEEKCLLELIPPSA